MQTNKTQTARENTNLVDLLLEKDLLNLSFKPTISAFSDKLTLQKVMVELTEDASDIEVVEDSLRAGAFTRADVLAIIAELDSKYQIKSSSRICKRLFDCCVDNNSYAMDAELSKSHSLENIAFIAIKLINNLQQKLLNVKPFTEIHFKLSENAKVLLRFGWEAMAKHGRFPLPPQGPARLSRIRSNPTGVMHFVSASDRDAGYLYTMGIALSPEAQALGTMDLSYGLDGELIVPGQAVSPIPPTLAMATRLFAAAIPTSSNISEDIQSIPYSAFAHPEVMDVKPMRGYILEGVKDKSVEHAKEQLKTQLEQYKNNAKEQSAFLPAVGAAIDITSIAEDKLVAYVKDVLKDIDKADHKHIALFLMIKPHADDSKATSTHFVETPRYKKTCQVIDFAKELGLNYVSVCDENEDEWQPNLLEYFTASELNKIADYSDAKGVVVCDGRPVDPVYTASTAAQRIQSVYTTLSVDILKMGMWLCLDALSARQVWAELQKNPHIPERMFLMPIGIVEPYTGFVDNRDQNKTPRAVIDPFEKIQFMIEEAKAIGAPSLLTDTRHKARWVLLGAVDGDLKAHPRENKENGAQSLIGHKKFMACEKLARDAGVILGQAGSIETEQIFWIMSDTTFDAAKSAKNPATAIWTAETERVIRRKNGESLHGDLQSQRRAPILPFLALTNRANESHGKLDGWLRFLKEIGKGDEALRSKLTTLREQVSAAQEAFLDASSQHDNSIEKVQTAWDNFVKSFQDYHAAIKSNFVKIRDAVQHKWDVAKTKSKTHIHTATEI